MYSGYSEADVLGAGILALLGAMGIIFFIVLLIEAFVIFARWMYFRKCGEGGWKSLIPVYNELTLLKTAGMNWQWIFVIVGAPVIVYLVSYISSFASAVNSYSYYDYGTVATTSLGLSLLTSLISLVASAAIIIVKIGEAINISKRFKKSGGYAVLIVFFEPIMLLILGLSGDKYDPKVKVNPNGIFGGKQVAASSSDKFCTKCGAEIKGNFCEKCGNKVGK